MESNALTLGYTGVYCDPVTCGYPLGNGYRMYLPELMRFNSPDSWSPFGKGGIHPYAYCEADPINLADPSGHFGGLGILGVLSTLIDVVVAEEEAANIATDAGLAAARATRATAGAVDEGVASSSRAAESVGSEASEPLAKRPRLEGLDEAGTSQSTAPQPESQVENIEQPAPASIYYPGIRDELGRLEVTRNILKLNIDQAFGQGTLRDPSLRQRWMRRDFWGGLWKAFRTDAGGMMNTVRIFSTILGWRFAHVEMWLTSLPEEELALLPEERQELTQRMSNLRTEIGKLANAIQMDQKVLDDFARINLPQ